jgi:hypothetical protein
VSDAKWYIDPQQYAEIRLTERYDSLNGTNNLEAFVMKVFGRPVEIVVTPDGQRPKVSP